MGKDYVAGVSFSGTTAQVAVLELRSGSISVAHLHEFQKGGGGAAHWFLAPLLQREHKLYKKVEKVSVAFDEAALLLFAFPVDAALDHVERNRHVQWELSNFVPEFSPKDYIIDTHVLRTRAQEQFSDLLVLSARRTLVFGVQQALAAGRYELGTADARLFGGLYALLVNYPELKDVQSALVLLSDDRIDIGTVAHGRFIAYAQRRTAIDEEKIAFVRSTLEAGAMTRAHLFGNASPALLHGLQEALGPGAERLNPLRRLPLRSSFDNTFAGQEYRFAASIGVALRKD